MLLAICPQHCYHIMFIQHLTKPEANNLTLDRAREGTEQFLLWLHETAPPTLSILPLKPFSLRTYFLGLLEDPEIQNITP